MSKVCISVHKCAKVERQSQSVEFIVGGREDAQELATFVIISRDFLPFKQTAISDGFKPELCFSTFRFTKVHFMLKVSWTPGAIRFPRVGTDGSTGFGELRYYRLRWELETAFRDAKQNFGFDAYPVQSQKSISRLVQLSFVATSIIQWLFVQQRFAASLNVDDVLKALGIHWYHPKKLTRGLMGAYLRYLFFCHLFSVIKASSTFFKKMPPRSKKASSL